MRRSTHCWRVSWRSSASFRTSSRIITSAIPWPGSASRMLYEVTHTTTYEYTGAVSVSYHVLRLRPRGLDRQACRWNELHIDPRPVVTKSHTDYFGNSLTFVTIEGAHHELLVTSRSHVDV